MVSFPERAAPEPSLGVPTARIPPLVLAPARASRATPAVAERLESIDALRGVALVLMAADHAAYYADINITAERYVGHALDLSAWPHVLLGLITNLAAPIFWLLAGVSVFLLSARRTQRGASPGSITGFLLLRATLLVLLDLGLCTFLWRMGPDPLTTFGLDVLASLGVSLALLCGLRFLPARVLWPITFAVLAGYPALLAALPVHVRETNSPWLAFFLTFSNTSVPRVWFPVLAWIGLMMAGFLLGPHLARDGARRPSTWVAAGIALLGVWGLIRRAGAYGTFTPMEPGEPWYRLFIMSKGPPALDYLAFNLGLACFVFASLNRNRSTLRVVPVSWLVACGQTPLFFYVAHLAVYRAIGPAFVAGWGRDLHMLGRYALVYGAGLALVIPLCCGYRMLRRRRPDGILQLF